VERDAKTRRGLRAERRVCVRLCRARQGSAKRASPTDSSVLSLPDFERAPLRDPGRNATRIANALIRSGARHRTSRARSRAQTAVDRRVRSVTRRSAPFASAIPCARLSTVGEYRQFQAVQLGSRARSRAQTAVNPKAALRKGRAD
jgi:hypothetical protein